MRTVRKLITPAARGQLPVRYGGCINDDEANTTCVRFVGWSHTSNLDTENSRKQQVNVAQMLRQVRVAQGEARYSANNCRTRASELWPRQARVRRRHNEFRIDI